MTLAWSKMRIVNPVQCSKKPIELIQNGEKGSVS